VNRRPAPPAGPECPHAVSLKTAAGRAPVEPPTMALAVLSLVNGVIVASVIDPDGPYHREVAAQLLALLLAADGSMDR
jgi:hypothetical protein